MHFCKIVVDSQMTLTKQYLTLVKTYLKKKLKKKFIMIYLVLIDEIS